MVERWMRQKRAGSKILLEFRDAAAQHVRSLSDVEAGVVVGGFDPIDLGGSQERDLTGALDGEAIELSRVIFAEFDFLLCAVEGEIEARVVEGLQEVVERSGFEGAQCVLIVGGDEDDGGGTSLPRSSSTSKPSHSGI